MNQNTILRNLKEARQELEFLITDMEKSPEYSFENFHLSMAHLYHHLNCAWNARNVTASKWRNQTNADYEQWQRFPSDLPLIGDDDFYDLPEYGDNE